MATIIEATERVNSVRVEGLALLKIVKHCHDALPQMVTGSMLGMVEGGVLEVTHAFPFPESRVASSDRKQSSSTPVTAASVLAGSVDEDGVVGGSSAAGLDGHEFQMEMMRMLREVNVDNNCVGWYQSMYLGIYSTSSLLENQLSYQTDLSPNAVVLLYDPMQTAHGNLVLKCYRLTEACIDLKTGGKNKFIDPNNIFEEIPVYLTNPGLARALLSDIVADEPTGGGGSGGNYHHDDAVGHNCLRSPLSPLTVGTDTTFDRLDLSTNPYLEKHLEYLCSWVDDLASEQQKFQYYTRQLSQGQRGQDGRRGGGNNITAAGREAIVEGWASSEAPRRMESLLVTNQIRSYCNQMDKFAGGGLSKLFLAGGFHKEEREDPTS